MLQQASKQIAVMGRRWDGGAPVHRLALEGQSLERVVLDTIQAMRRERQYSRAQARSLLRYARCRVNGFEIPRAQWADTWPKPDDRIEVLRGVLGGGQFFIELADINFNDDSGHTLSPFWENSSARMTATTD